MLSLNYYGVVIEYCRGYWTVVWSLKWLSFNFLNYAHYAQFRWSIGTNGTIGTNGKAPYSNGSIGDYASH